MLTRLRNVGHFHRLKNRVYYYTQCHVNVHITDRFVQYSHNKDTSRRTFCCFFFIFYTVFITSYMLYSSTYSKAFSYFSQLAVHD
jgi:hypothetical protein